MIIKLVFKGLQQERARWIMAIFGVAAATGLVVWSLGLTMTSIGQSREKVRQMSDPFACWVSATGMGMPMDRAAMMRGVRSPFAGTNFIISNDVVRAVEALSDVRSVTPVKTLRTTIDYRPGGRVLQGPPMSTVLALADPDAPPYRGVKIRGRWPDPESDEAEAAVCTSIFAPRRLELPPLGSTLVLITPSGTVNVKISAYIEMEQVVAGFPTSFVTRGVMNRALGEGYDTAPNLLLCQLRGGADGRSIKETVAGMTPMLERPVPRDEEPLPPVPLYSVVERRDIEANYSSDALTNIKRQAPLLLTLSILTAFCMLFNALTIGVEQRLRVLALLRSAGMTTRQVAQIVVVEGLAIAVSGWLVGVLVGWGVVALYVRGLPEVFPEGVFLGGITPVVTGVGVLVIAAVSLWWPCRHAVRIRPLDMLAEDQGEPRPINRVRSIIGLLLLFPMLVLVLPMHISAMTRSVLLLAVGLPLHAAGLFMVLPAFIRAVEFLSVPFISRMLALDTRMLRGRISQHFARTAGMVITLAVGLGTFVSIHIWGGSMMDPFVPSREFPDVIVSLLPNGVEGEAAEVVAALDGVEDGRCLTLEVSQYEISAELQEQVERVTGRPAFAPNVLLMGAEPGELFGGVNPLAPFRFYDGSGSDVVAALADGSGCVITRMLARQTGLKVGDTLSIVKRRPVPRRMMGRGRPGDGGGVDATTSASPVSGADGKGGPRGKVEHESFRVVGVADVNWHLITSRANLRGREGMPGMTMGPVFVSEGKVRELNGNSDITYFLWLNLSDEYRKLGPLPAGQLLEAEIRKAIEVGESNTVRVHHRDEIEDGTIARGAQLLGAMARAPFWSLIVLASGMVTLLIASYQASAREIGVMRAVGMTRSQLGRMLFGEALLVALCGVVLSLVSGFCIGWTFTGWTRAWMMFGGLPVSLSIPWLVIGRGVGFALVLCIVMSAIPVVWLINARRSAYFR